MNDIFIMQGRLLKDKRLPLQSFPYSTWQDEFKLCKKIGFTGIDADGIPSLGTVVYLAL